MFLDTYSEASSLNGALLCQLLLCQDTREEREYKVSHLANAVRLNPEETDMSNVIKTINKEGTNCLATTHRQFVTRGWGYSL